MENYFATITVEKFDELYPKALKGFGVKVGVGGMVDYYSRALTILEKPVKIWWHSIPEMASIAHIECADKNVCDFITDRMWEARND